MIEIERKYLVISNAYKQDCYAKTTIIQGFISTQADNTVRVRIAGDTGFLTIKGASYNNGLSRYEWETTILKHDAEQLLKLCKTGIIKKIRYKIRHKNHIFEVDEFLDLNEGLVIAEVELTTENEKVDKPNWLGVEVTGQKKYYNSQLSNKPFSTWSKH